MKKTILASLLALPLFLTPAMASADDDDGALILSFFGTAYDSVSQDDGDRDNSYNYGLGAFIEANINGHFGIETGAMFVNKQYEREAAGVELVREVGRLHVPVLLKFWVNDYFSLGAGPFLATKIGDITTEVNVGGVDVGDFDSSADDDVEFGYDLTATLNFALADKTGIFVEGRYSALFDEEDGEDTDEIYALVGLKISL